MLAFTDGDSALAANPQVPYGIPHGALVGFRQDGGPNQRAMITTTTLDIAALRVLRAVESRLTDVSFDVAEHSVGAAEFLRSGDPLPDESFAACRAANVVLLGAMGLPSVRWPDGKEMTPQIDLRERLDLYAGPRPIKLHHAKDTPLKGYAARQMDTAGWAALCLSVAVFVADMTLAPSWAFCTDIGGQHSGVVSGTLNMAGNLGSFVSTLAFPCLPDWTGSHVACFYVAAGLNLLAVMLWIATRPEQPLEAAA